MDQETTNTLIATLGVNPQVVTISLDLLREKGHQIDGVITIYTDNEKVKEGLTRLNEELKRMGTPSHRSVPILGPTGPVSDFWAKADATALLQTLHREVKACKQAGHHIHLMIAGGRGIMGAYALVVAQLLFDEYDQVWYLFSDFWQQERNRKMHREPGDHAILVPVPVLRWTPMATVAADFALTDDPWQVIERQQELQQRERDLRLHTFWHYTLSDAERQVIRLLAEGLSNEVIIARRGRSKSTVTKQLSTIYEKWRGFWGLPETASVRDRIVVELSAYFTRHRE